MRRFVAALAIVLLLTGCKSMWSSMKSSAAPAGGAASGAAIGMLAPPFGPIIGAAVGAVIIHAIAENAALRSGETIGEESLDKQVVRWAADYGKERVARVAAKEGERYRGWLIGGAVLFLVWLRRQWIWKTITGQGVQSRFWTLIHALTGGNITRRLAVGVVPMIETKKRPTGRKIRLAEAVKK